MKIDAHQHFWKYDPEKHEWINDKMSVLKHDYLPEMLKMELTSQGINGSVAVQADQSEAENEFLLNLASKNDFIKGVVGWVDLKSPGVEEKLAEYSKDPLIKGFRHVLQDEPDPAFILDKQFQHGLSHLDKYGFTYDILIFPHQMASALKVVENHPYQKFVIDHISKPDIKHRKMDEWISQINAFGTFENVYCKISGMVTEADWFSWQNNDFEPYLDIVFEAFGPERLMYGSDWPVCLLAAKYDQVKGITDKYIEKLSPAEQAQVMGLTAIDFYNIDAR